MATITYLGPWRQPATGEAGVFSQLSNTRISIVYAQSGITETYAGDFQVSGSTLLGGSASSFQSSYAGQPFLVGTGVNVPVASAAAAVLSGNSATLFNFAWAGDDVILGSRGSEPISGGLGADTVIALDGNDTISGGLGNDNINGNVGDDFVRGDGGADWLLGGKGDDTLLGGDGDDLHLNGNLGNDLVNGEAGADTLYGGQGADTLSGGDGNDIVSGDLGDDLLIGGAGADRFVLRSGDGLNVIADFNAGEGDRVLMARGAAYRIGLIDGHVFYELDGGRTVLQGVSDASHAANWIIAV